MKFLFLFCFLFPVNWKNAAKLTKTACSMASAANYKEEVRTRDIVYGHSNQHHRNVPIVISNIVLKYFNNTYHTNKQLRIKDILLPKFNFVESIVTAIEHYLPFERCDACTSITWSNTFGYIECVGSNCTECDVFRCEDCLEKFEYAWTCQYKYHSGQCQYKYCKKCYRRRFWLNIPPIIECGKCDYNLCEHHYHITNYTC